MTRILVIGDDELDELVHNEFQRFPLSHLEADFSHSSTLESARRRIESTPPKLVVLSPDTPLNSKKVGPRRPSEVLKSIGVTEAVQVLVALNGPDEEWACEAVERGNLAIWDWATRESKLEHLAALLLSPPKSRRLKAIIHLRLPQPLCDVYIDNRIQFRNLVLKGGPIYTRDWGSENLKLYFDMENRTDGWNGLAAQGRILFDGILDDLGEALVSAQKNGASLDLRFEMDSASSSINNLFSMPIELLNVGASWDGFFCRIASMARRVRHRQSLEPRSPVIKPRILFIDASATAGAMRVVGNAGELVNRIIPDLFENARAEQRLIGGLSDVCELELLQLPPGQSGKDLLKKRLLNKTSLLPQIVHFSGHAITSYGGTELILPGSEDGIVDRLNIGLFANWLPDGVILVVLSACQGVAADTAKLLHAERNVSVLGFRWEVIAAESLHYIENFYKAYFSNGQEVASAYNEACRLGDATEYAWAAAALLDHS